jgi:hypothetical protein
MATKLEASAAKIEQALKQGENSAEYKALTKGFEQNFHKPINPVDLARIADKERQILNALNDNGKQGYRMIGKNQDYFAKHGLPDHSAAGVFGGKVIFINTDNAFKSEKEIGYSLAWILGHEAAHNNWVAGDVYRFQPEYRTLTPKQALDNADSYIDFAHRQ